MELWAISKLVIDYLQQIETGKVLNYSFGDK